MRPLGVVGGIVLLLASGLFASPVTPIDPLMKQGIEPYGSRSYAATFEGGQKATIIALGTGRSDLGLYVYDEHGNCVGLDEGKDQARDDLAVIWYPAGKQRVTIEVRNLGSLSNEFDLALR